MSESDRRRMSLERYLLADKIAAADDAALGVMATAVGARDWKDAQHSRLTALLYLIVGQKSVLFTMSPVVVASYPVGPWRFKLQSLDIGGPPEK